MLEIRMDDLEAVSNLFGVSGVADSKEGMSRDPYRQLGHVAIEFATSVLFPRVRQARRMELYDLNKFVSESSRKGGLDQPTLP